MHILSSYQFRAFLSAEKILLHPSHLQPAGRAAGKVSAPAVHSMVTSTPCPHHEFVCSATNNLCVIRRKARGRSIVQLAISCLSCGLVVDYRGLLIRGDANQWAAAPSTSQPTIPTRLKPAPVQSRTPHATPLPACDYVSCGLGKTTSVSSRTA